MPDASEAVIWEYELLPLQLSVKDGIEESRATLNAEGVDGWELVSVVPKMGKNPSLDCLAFLKRRKRL